MEKQNSNRFLEKINETQKMLEETNENIYNLVEGINSLGEKVSELEKIKELNDFVSNLGQKINILEKSNSVLGELLEKTEKFNNLTQEISNTEERLENIVKGVKAINDSINIILSNQKEADFSELLEKIEDVGKNFDKLYKYVSDNLINYINNDLSIAIDNLNNEVIQIKDSFDNYKDENSRLIDTYMQENKKIADYFRESLNTNKQIINMFNELRQDNNNAENFLDNFMENWYKKNVGFLGFKKIDKR